MFGENGWGGNGGRNGRECGVTVTGKGVEENGGGCGGWSFEELKRGGFVYGDGRRDTYG